jgi:hypothetical protein
MLLRMWNIKEYTRVLIACPLKRTSLFSIIGPGDLAYNERILLVWAAMSFHIFSHVECHKYTGGPSRSSLNYIHVK